MKKWIVSFLGDNKLQAMLVINWREIFFTSCKLGYELSLYWREYPNVEGGLLRFQFSTLPTHRTNR